MISKPAFNLLFCHL